MRACEWGAGRCSQRCPHPASHQPWGRAPHPHTPHTLPMLEPPLGDREGSAWTDGPRPSPSDPQPGLTRASGRQVGPWRTGVCPPAPVERHGKGTSARRTEVAPEHPQDSRGHETSPWRRVADSLTLPRGSPEQGPWPASQPLPLGAKAGDKACGPPWPGFQTLGGLTTRPTEVPAESRKRVRSQET